VCNKLSESIMHSATIKKSNVVSSLNSTPHHYGTRGNEQTCRSKTSLPRHYHEVYAGFKVSYFMGFFLSWLDSPSGTRPYHCWGFDITLIHTTLCRIPLDEWTSLGRDVYPTTHNNHRRQKSMPPVGFEPAVPISERPQTHALGRVWPLGSVLFGLGEFRNQQTV
jgi:hypothetical protein